MGKYYRHFTWTDRLRIEAMTNAGYSAREIADKLRCHISSIYRELKRGRYEHKNSDWTFSERYSPEMAEEKYRTALTEKGGHLKIGNDHKLAKYLEDKIVDDKYSPAAALAQIERDGLIFSVSLSINTIYRYIDKGLFLRLTNKDLPVKGKRKRKYDHVRATRPPRGESIENRPDEINDRTTFGHWEMDTVKGKRNTKKVMLVLTERLTRKEIQLPMAACSEECVVSALDALEHRLGDLFRMIFLSITVDNGSEFHDCEGMERSCRNNDKRTIMYYCHPYSSWERGSNELQNRMIRRWIPKGTPIEDVPDEHIAFVQNWLNNYPRQLHGWKSADDIWIENITTLIPKNSPQKLLNKLSHLT